MGATDRHADPGRVALNGDVAEHPVTQVFAELLDRIRAEDHPGNLADYIPELARADPDRFGISASTVFGRLYDAGDAGARFTIQSISKPFVLALAMNELGVDRVLEHVGLEPSGQPFNAISFDPAGRPDNPMINAGAIVTTSIMPAADGEERFARIRAGLSAFAGRDLELAEDVYRSEAATGDRNRALAALARANGVLGSTVEEAIDPYFRQCSLLVDAHDLALMGATLANGGVQPVTEVRVIDEWVARDALSLMASCGMYDRSGDWLFTVGMPAKSGVGGGIVAVTPGKYGIGVFSPPLDPAGNSSRGVAALQALSKEFGLHLLEHPKRPASPIERIDADPASSTVTIALRGELDFVAMEQVAHEAVGTLRERDGGRLVVDVDSVTRATPVVARLLQIVAAEASGRGWAMTIIDPGGVLSV